MRAGRVAVHGHAFADITGYHAACTDQRVIANAYARQDQGTCAYPDVLANGHRAAELKPAASYCGITRMVGSEDLHAGRDLGVRTDAYRDDIQDHAVEIEEYAFAKSDIEPVIAMERWPYHRTVAHQSETLVQQHATLRCRTIRRCVVSGHPCFCSGLCLLDFLIARVVQVASKHLLHLGRVVHAMGGVSEEKIILDATRAKTRAISTDKKRAGCATRFFHWMVAKGSRPKAVYLN